MICEKCIHHDICILGCPEFIESATENGFCGKFTDNRLYIKLPCLPGKKLYYIDKDCASCEKFITIDFSDHVDCIDDDEADLFEPVIHCEACKKHLQIKDTTCSDFSHLFKGMYSSFEKAEEEMEKIKNS